MYRARYCRFYTRKRAQMRRTRARTIFVAERNEIDKFARPSCYVRRETSVDR